MEKLQLSDLSHGVDYPMPCAEYADRCRIHVKMTESSMKSVEALIHSDKGAFFSLWFEESGGRISIPVGPGGRDRVFQLKMAPGGGQSRRGILECVHQELKDDNKHQLKCLGPLEHRLTVQGTDDSYVQTKKKMEQAEIERNKRQAQEIKIFKGQSKSKKILTQPVERSLSPAVRKPNRPVQPRPPPPSGSLKHSANKSSSGGGTGSPRPSHSLKERVIHLLALKPQKRPDLVARLKKETKRSETNMSKLDDILSDVGELVQGAYRLRASYSNSVQVKDWPFYSEMERQMLKRKLVSEQTATETVTAAAKRPLPTTTSSSTAASSTDSEPASKKARLVNSASDRSTLIPTPPPPTLQTGQTSFPSNIHVQHASLTTTQSNNSHLHSHGIHSVHGSDSKMNGSVSKSDKEAESSMTSQPPLTLEKPNNSMKKKKKKKQKHNSKETGLTNATVVTSDPTSTTNIPDYASQFPPISSDEQRAHYKKIFGEDYEEYNSLKEHIETISPVCAALSEKLDSLPKHSEEAKEVRQQIRNKYRELQPHKSRFDELHHKLDHIKKMVVDYDATMFPT